MKKSLLFSCCLIGFVDWQGTTDDRMEQQEISYQV